MKRVVMSEFEEVDIKRLYGEGKKFEILQEDQGELIFEVNAADLKKTVDKEKGFRIAPGHVVTFENYSDIYEDEDGKFYIKIGTTDNRDRKKSGTISTSEFDAYVLEFGINKFKIKGNVKLKEKEVKSAK
jgi:hypothetical protein